jgi:hypothetical protein
MFLPFIVNCASYLFVVRHLALEHLTNCCLAAILWGRGWNLLEVCTVFGAVSESVQDPSLRLFGRRCAAISLHADAVPRQES